MNKEIKERLNHIRSGIVTPGYKKTKIGIIPEEWEMNLLGDICSFSQGIQIDLIEQKNSYKDGYIRFLRIENYTQDSNDFRFIKKKKNILSKVIDINDIVVVRYGATAGFVGYGLDGVLANNLFKVSPDKRYLNNTFLYIILKNNRTFQYLQKAMFGGAMPAISFSIIKNYKISVPPLPEQHRIAEILSTWDKAIELKEKLIEQKKLQKRGLMQMLLTGKKRLPGFSGEWKEVKLGKLIEKWADGGTPSRKTNNNYFNGDINWIVINDIKHYISETKEKLTLAGLKNCSSELWSIGSVILSTGATIGLCGILIIKSATKQGITGIIVKKEMLNNEYLRYWFVSNKKLLLRFAQGSSFKEIRTYNLAKILFSKPILREQKVIVSLLSKADQDIEILEKELEQLKEQKRGLMQLLLTGIVRVNDLIPDPSPNEEKGEKSFLDRKDLGR